MAKYQCGPCGYIYDPAEGDPDGGIAPGTPFEDLPEDWCCPICGVGKASIGFERPAGLCGKAGAILDSEQPLSLYDGRIALRSAFFKRSGKIGSDLSCIWVKGGESLWMMK